MSRYGDFAVLGSNFVILKLKFASRGMTFFDSSNLPADDDKNPLLKHNHKHLPLIAAMLCYDFMKRVPNVGLSTIFKIIFKSAQ